MKKSIVSITLTFIMLLSIITVLPKTLAQASGTELKIEDAVTGLTDINFTTNNPPPGGYFLVNISIYNVERLAAWQVNITWDPTLLEIENKAIQGDMYVPADNVFGSYADIVPPQITVSSAYLMVGIKSGAPFETTGINGSGRLCVVRFHVLKAPTKTEPLLTSPIHFVLAGEYPIRTKLVDPEAVEISFTPYDGTYNYQWLPPILPKPYLSVNPALIEKGKPTGPSIIGTPKALFQVDIIITDIVNDSMLTALQFAFKYPTDLFRLVPYSADLNASAGTFMNRSDWAPYGADFWTTYGGKTAAGIEKQYVFWSINPNTTTNEFDWGKFPDSTGLSPADRVICTFYFEATVQEESPWYQYVTGAFDIDYVFPSMPERMFLNANEEWIPAKPPVDGDYAIYGWVMGLMIDVYTQYPEPYGGQGLNATSDMFLPQATVVLHAKVTYNGDPVQNKPVAFQVFNEKGYVNFTKTAVTDENGVATVTFGIPWPCSGAEDNIFGIWTVVASTTVRERTAFDWLWFKVYWLVYNLKVTAEPDSVKKGEIGNFTVTFETFRQQPIPVLIHIVIMDNLQVPVGEASIWVTVGDPNLKWCENKTYTVTFGVPIPKWAFVGEGEIEVSALSNWPAEGGVPFCPEATGTFTILKYT